MIKLLIKKISIKKIFASLIITSYSLLAQNSFTLTLSRQSAYPFESIKMVNTLHYDGSKLPSGIEIDKLNIKGAHIHKMPTLQNSSAHDIYYTSVIIPRKAGWLNIPAQKIYIPHHDPETYRKVWQVLSTKPVKIEIKPLPSGISATGNYTLTSDIDHNITKPNVPIHMNIIIRGKGDLSAIAGLKPVLKDVTLFASKPTIKSAIDKNGTYQSILKQQFIIISEHSLTINPLHFRYLNSDTGLSEILSTPKYHITINRPLISKKQINYLLFTLLGILLGVILTLLSRRSLKILHQRSLPLQKKIRKTKSDKELYTLLLPYAHKAEIANILQKLEENIYSGANHKIDRGIIYEL